MNGEAVGVNECVNKVSEAQVTSASIQSALP